jgi:glucose/arabinose dehydrogenase
MIVRRAWPIARIHLGCTVLAGFLATGLGGASATFSDEALRGAPLQIVATGFEKPTGLVEHPQGFLLLTDPETGVLYRLTPGFTTAGEPAFSSEVLFAGLDEPIGVAVEPNEDLLVAEKDKGRLVRFGKLGEEVYSAVPEPVTGGLIDPRWLAVDREGSIFVSADGIKKEKLAKGMPNPKDDVLLKIAPDGAFSVIADGFKELRGLALDPAGNLFAGAERRQGDKQKHDGTIFKIRLPEGAVSPVIEGGFEGPRDLEFDGLGALFFTAKEIREER